MTRTMIGVRGRIAGFMTLALLAGVLGGVAGPASGQPEEETGIWKEDPEWAAGNQNCALPGDATYELRVEPVASGTYTDPATGFSVELSVTNGGKPNFAFTTSGGAAAVVYVKGGPDTNEYDYSTHDDADGDDPATGFLASNDTKLHAPTNNGKYYGLSHISFCYETVGMLKVSKFIDVDQSGGFSDPPDIASGPDVAGWGFNVYEGTGTSGTLVTTLTTDDTGSAEVALTPGTYTVEEVDGGTLYVTTVDPLTQTLVAGGTTTYAFGNACRITKVFQVTGIPTGVTALSAFYTVTTDVKLSNSSTEQEVVLTDGGNGTLNDGIWAGTAGEAFDVGDSLTWEYGTATDRESGDTHDFVVADGYPSCTTTNTVEFAPPTVTVLKLKDLTADGPTADDTEGLAGWDFKLYADNGDTTGSFDGNDSLIETLTTGADGKATNSIALAPGVYHVEEVEQTNWTVTSDKVQTLDLQISEDADVVFSNAPEAKFDVRFFDLTTRTDATIDCTKVADGNGDPVSLSVGSQSGDTLESGNVLAGEYECSIVIIDP